MRHPAFYLLLLNALALLNGCTAGLCPFSGLCFGQNGGVGGGGLATALQVLSITPAYGSYKGGVPVKITGAGFQAGALVSVAGTACQGVTIVSSSEIDCTTSGATIPVQGDVVVTNINGKSSALAGAYGHRRFAYTYGFAGLADTFSIDPTSGSLTAECAGGNFLAESNVQYHGAGAAIGPSGKFLYLLDWVNTTLVTAQIAAADGCLTKVGNTPLPGGGFAGELAMHPSGKFLYSTDYSTALVYGFSLDPITGIPTPVAGSPYATGGQTGGMVFDPQAKYLYVSSTTSVAAYSINPATGVLTPLAGSPYATSGASYVPLYIAAGGFLYLVDFTGGKINGFTVAPATGVLSPIPGSPFAVGPLNGAVDSLYQMFASDPAGKFLYLADNQNAGKLYGYAIGPGGVPSAVPGSPYAVGIETFAVKTDPTGQYLYLGCELTGKLHGYSINSGTGALTELGASPWNGLVPNTHVHLVFDPIEPWLYFSEQAFSFNGYTFNSSTGDLTAFPSGPYSQNGTGEAMILVP